MKAGAVIITHRNSTPLVLCGIGYKNKYVLSSWDKFEVPKFFSKVNVVYSDPIFIEKDLERDEVSKIIDDCNVRLNELQSEAEKFD